MRGSAWCASHANLLHSLLRYSTWHIISKKHHVGLDNGRQRHGSLITRTAGAGVGVAGGAGAAGAAGSAQGAGWHVELRYTSGHYISTE